ncbi:MAG: hypothetical protein U0Y82_17015 [Thermoleophilia bacterium]
MDPNTGWSTEARSSLVTLQPDGFPLSGVVPKKGEPWTQWHVMALLAAIAGLVGPELRQALIEACFRYANLSRDEWFMKRRELARLWGLTPEQREEFFSIQVSEVAFFKARFLREALDRAARQPEGSRVRLCIEEMRADYESVLRAAIVRKREDQGPGLLASLTERAEGRTRRRAVGGCMGRGSRGRRGTMTPETHLEKMRSGLSLGGRHPAGNRVRA